MLNVQIVLFDGFDLLDAIAPYEVFCAAAMMTGGEVRVELVTAEGARAVPSGINGLKIEAAGGRLVPSRKGIILLPGAAGELEGDGPNAIPAILACAMGTELSDMLGTAMQEPDVVIATVCGGSVLLGMGGWLEGRPAVTNRLGMDFLGAMGAVPVAARVVEDGRLVMGGGVTSGLDVALYLVERELGPRIAHAIEQLFEYERRGTVWRNSGLTPKSPTEAGDTSAEADAEPIRKLPANGDMERGKSPFDGIWDTIISTPIGKLAVKLDIATVNGRIQGKATMEDEVSMFIDPVASGSRLRWSQRITKPIRLNLKFDVAATGNQMTGTAKAGVLPASALDGKRRVEV
ncbi:DJ-1/PfpI family protein [Paenibacillus soyae]|uniref:DJ-1/PfpI family protein n=1 Tax=Paenibacillus soyae TaxID=2969249 RepID=A0A9X2S9U7_9BACL|nr:DJ-1/PfpI family protein [Paenibacillus soyae]MCR2805849.1 DJ-1/PfpI family protein [Paenibacillus soyae]